MIELFTTENLIAFLTLLTLEIVLGIDNVIFIAILSAKLPAEQQDFARKLGISLAVVTRIALLFAIAWIMSLTEPLFSVFGLGLSGRSLILILGGLFLVGKSTHEIGEKLEHEETGEEKPVQYASFVGTIAQILLIDVVFSFDSVITAVGISGIMAIMVPAILIAAAVMLFFAGAISEFVEKHPTMKILALAFLIMIGALLIFEGINPELAHDLHIKNYAYFAMAFSVCIELLNIRIRRRDHQIKINRPHMPKASSS